MSTVKRFVPQVKSRKLNLVLKMESRSTVRIAKRRSVWTLFLVFMKKNQSLARLYVDILIHCLKLRRLSVKPLSFNFSMRFYCVGKIRIRLVLKRNVVIFIVDNRIRILKEDVIQQIISSMTLSTLSVIDIAWIMNLIFIKLMIRMRPLWSVVRRNVIYSMKPRNVYKN